MQIRMENHGSVWLARPMDDEANQWLIATAPSEAQFMGSALAIEPRYVEAFLEVFVDEGGEAI